MMMMMLLTTLDDVDADDDDGDDDDDDVNDTGSDDEDEGDDGAEPSVMVMRRVGRWANWRAHAVGTTPRARQAHGFGRIPRLSWTGTRSALN